MRPGKKGRQPHPLLPRLTQSQALLRRQTRTNLLSNLMIVKYKKYPCTPYLAGICKLCIYPLVIINYIVFLCLPQFAFIPYCLLRDSEEWDADSRDEDYLLPLSRNHRSVFQYQTSSGDLPQSCEVVEDQQEGIVPPPTPPCPSIPSATPSPAPLSMSPYNTTLETSSSLRERSGSPGVLTPCNARHGYLNMSSLKSLSVTPYNTTLEESVLSPKDTSDSLFPHPHQTAAEAMDAVQRPTPVRLQATGIDYSALEPYRDLSMSTLTATDLYTSYPHTETLTNDSQHALVQHNELGSHDHIGQPETPFTLNSYPPIVSIGPLFAPSLDVTVSSVMKELFTDSVPGSRSNLTASISPVKQISGPFRSHCPSTSISSSTNVGQSYLGHISPPFKNLDFSSAKKHPDTSVKTEVNDDIQKHSLEGSITEPEQNKLRNTCLGISPPNQTSPDLNIYTAQTSNTDLPSISSPEVTPSCFSSSFMASPSLRQTFGNKEELLPSNAPLSGSQDEHFQVGHDIPPKLLYQAVTASGSLTNSPSLNCSPNISENTLDQVTEIQAKVHTLDQYPIQQFHASPLPHALSFSTPANSPGKPVMTSDTSESLWHSPQKVHFCLPGLIPQQMPRGKGVASGGFESGGHSDEELLPGQAPSEQGLQNVGGISDVTVLNMSSKQRQEYFMDDENAAGDSISDAHTFGTSPCVKTSSQQVICAPIVRCCHFKLRVRWAYTKLYKVHILNLNCPSPPPPPPPPPPIF